MAFHPATNRIVMYGGWSVDGLQNDTWTWDGQSWTLALGNGPGLPRDDGAMALAPDGKVMMFGGSECGRGSPFFLNDTHTWDGVNWNGFVASPSPSARGLEAMAFDATHNRTVMFGGIDSGQFVLADTWLWDGSNWTQAQPAHHPSARTDGAMVYDAAHGNVMLFGGNCGNETWLWDGNDWTQLAPSSAPPAGVIARAIAYDPLNRNVVLFGGFSCNSRVPDPLDTWVWDGSTWHSAVLNPPRWPHYGGDAVLAANSANVLAFVGRRGFYPEEYTYAWDGSWHVVQGNPAPPKYVAFGDSLTTGWSVATCNTQPPYFPASNRLRSPWGCNPDEFSMSPATPYPNLLAQDPIRGYRFSDSADYYYSKFFPLPDHPDLDLDRVGIWGYRLADALRDDNQHFNSDPVVTKWTPQLEAVRMAQNLVTGALGINDLDFPDLGVWAPRRLQDLYVVGSHAVQDEADRRMQALEASGAFQDLFLSLDQAHSNGATIVLVLYYNPLAPNPTCAFTTLLAQRMVDTVNGKLQQFAAPRPWIRIANTDLEMMGHGAGSANPWVFGRTCDGGRIISSLLPGWFSQGRPLTAKSLKDTAEKEFDPHPNNSGTAAQALAVRKALG